MTSKVKAHAWINPQCNATALHNICMKPSRKVHAYASGSAPHHHELTPAMLVEDTIPQDTGVMMSPFVDKREASWWTRG